MLDIVQFKNSTKDDVLRLCASEELLNLSHDQKTIPALARNKNLTAQIEDCLSGLPTNHQFFLGDVTSLGSLKPESVHLVVTSPPYWTLKKYHDHERQLGDVQDYDQFLKELAKVWKLCYRALIPGGRAVIVVGDVCLSRRQNKGRHVVVPLHASIQEQCRKIGFDNLAPIIWHKIANAKFEAGGTSTFLGKPYEPNAVIKNDIEYILMQRKPGAYRSPSFLERVFSVIPDDKHKEWFVQIWIGLTGASTKNHPAPYPITLAARLIRMFSFVGDTVLDPFLGSGTTSVAAWQCGRNSVGVEVDTEYLDMAISRFEKESMTLMSSHSIEIHRS